MQWYAPVGTRGRSFIFKCPTLPLCDAHIVAASTSLASEATSVRAAGWNSLGVPLPASLIERSLRYNVPRAIEC